jgi:3-hydroxybutyryl-CoA dehydrogenase
MSASTTPAAPQVVAAAVIGAGTMGAGIAQVLAQSGIRTVLFDVSQEAVDAGLERIEKMLQKGVERGKLNADVRQQALECISMQLDLAAAVDGCQLVIEAAPEKLELKQSLFAQIGAVVDDNCIIASNTSSLSVSTLAESCPHPERFIGLHFFNPPPIMKLLEIVRGAQTSDAIVEQCRILASDWGKEPIVVRDAPGFASSRLGLAIGLEAMRMVDEGVASPTDIDKAMKLGYGFPMGPLELTDMIGLDVRLDIARHLAEELNADRFATPRGLRERVENGNLGRKSGKGYYRWKDGKRLD